MEIGQSIPPCELEGPRASTDRGLAGEKRTREERVVLPLKVHHEPLGDSHPLKFYFGGGGKGGGKVEVVVVKTYGGVGKGRPSAADPPRKSTF